MKKSILLITLLALTFATTAQTKPTAKAKSDTATNRISTQWQIKKHSIKESSKPENQITLLKK